MTVVFGGAVPLRGIQMTFMRLCYW